MPTTMLKNELLSLLKSQRFPYAETFIYDASDLKETALLSQAPSRHVSTRSVMDLMNLSHLASDSMPANNFRRRLNDSIEAASAESWIAPADIFESIDTWRDQLPNGEFLYSEGAAMHWIGNADPETTDLEHTTIETPLGADTDWLAFRDSRGGLAISTPEHPEVPARLLITHGFIPTLETIAINVSANIIRY